MKFQTQSRNALGKALLLALAWAAVWAAPAPAVMLPVPLESSIERSDLVVRGRTIDQHCEWTADGRWIVTLVRFQVLETLQGEIPGPEVVVRVLGGVVDGIGLAVSDMPRFEPGEESILCLKQAGDGRSYLVTDNFQGKNTLEDGRIVERDLPAVEFLTTVRAIVRDRKY
jgi:hypothetical protein